MLVSFCLSEWQLHHILCISIPGTILWAYAFTNSQFFKKQWPKIPHQTYYLLVSLGGCRKYGNSGNWKAMNQLLQFLHAIKMFSLETEGFSRGKKVRSGGGGGISLTVQCPHRNGVGCRQRGPKYILLLLHKDTAVDLVRTCPNPESGWGWCH